MSEPEAGKLVHSKILHDQTGIWYAADWSTLTQKLVIPKSIFFQKAMEPVLFHDTVFESLGIKVFYSCINLSLLSQITTIKHIIKEAPNSYKILFIKKIHDIAKHKKAHKLKRPGGGRELLKEGKHY